MAYDFQKSQFTLRLPRSGQESIPTAVAKTAVALWQHKIKLAATLARMRVKENVRTLTELIPVTERRRYQDIVAQPLYARVNLQKVHNIQSEVLSALSDDSFVHVSSKDGLHLSPRGMQLTKMDLIAFSPDCRDQLTGHWLVSDGHLILQVSWFMNGECFFCTAVYTLHGSDLCFSKK